MAEQKPKSRGKMVNSFDPSNLDDLSVRQRDMIGRRNKLLGPAYRLFYQRPVEVCRGSGVHLYDSDGNEYLDAYNNVASVGHSHPRVVEAISSQLAKLCTHTRYLQDGILNYAEDLLSSFEGDVGHAMFTCTGSEANDLALRIAKYHTGNKGIIITSEAYHGNSDLTAGISPSLGIYSPLGEWVRRVPTPDSYRLGNAEISAFLVKHVSEQIVDLQRHGQGVAAFIADSLFSSDGIFSEPTDLLAPVADVVRKAGGIFIADEVQSGFGRSGDRFWGYQRHGVVPDIVTMGKPMGNGFPVAGIAIAPEIIEKFGHDTRYFNTFGGNSVAVTAAQATLDVIRDEGLQANANKVGKLIRDGFLELAKRYDSIGDVRGAGLYVGVEMVRDRQAKSPNAELATAVVNGLRERRVLISATGPHSNILKIRPPLVFSDSHAGRLLNAVEAVLASV
jgi:4-aminobutyrate aminotransferase-like enzyme